VETDLWIPFRPSIKEIIMRLIRTALFAPGINAKVMAKALASKVDAVILDLEDSVPLASKAEARKMVRETIEQAYQTKRDDQPYIMVRVNAADTGLIADDIEQICVNGLGMVFIPKAEYVKDIQQAAAQIEAIEKANSIDPIAIGLQIESALGVYHCYDLIKASPKVQLSSLGTAQDGDLQNSLGCGWSVDGPEMLYARSKVLLDSRAAGNVTPIDGVFADLNDEAGLLAESSLSAKLGYVGRTIIHPKQIDIVEQAYGLSATLKAYYQKLVQEFELAEKSGVAAITIDGKLVDYAMYRQAKRILDNIKQ
jgi:citrate lyase subunit beta/citryl-CoA lyase